MRPRIKPSGQSGADAPAEPALLLFNCAETVSESRLFQQKGLPFERKRIPQIVVIVRIQRKTMEHLEQTTVPYKQEVRGSSPRPPTILTNRLRRFFAPCPVIVHIERESWLADSNVVCVPLNALCNRSFRRPMALIRSGPGTACGHAHPAP
jgi:hypothetical protein